LNPSKVELHSQLNQARIVSLHKPTEVRRVDIAHRVEELGMVEDILGLEAKLQAGGFGELRILGEHNVHIVESRAVERIAAGIADRTQGGHREIVRIEVEPVSYMPQHDLDAA
jgi:hypothetical protein